MKVYTRKGDDGTTQLIGGDRVKKSTDRINAYGTVDELNSHIGLIRDQKIDTKYVEQLLDIQDRLFTLGSLLATGDGGTKMNLPSLQENDIQDLESWIDEMDSQLEPMKSFVLPGGHTIVSFTHIARCVCRRAERYVVEIDGNRDGVELSTKYLNRLSDYLFVLSRKLSKDLNAPEHPWVPKV